jgi:hypothetical protein
MSGWKSAAVAGLLGLSSVVATHSAIGQEKTKGAPPAAQHVQLTADQLKWGPGPPSLPPGAQVALLDGDPAAKGISFVMRAKLPDGYQVPPHWHPTDEHLVVLSGTLMLGMGPKLDEASMRSLGPGSYSKMPARMQHSAKAKGETVFQVHGVGPFEVTYVNPADDPRKKTSTSK